MRPVVPFLRTIEAGDPDQISPAHQFADLNPGFKEIATSIVAGAGAGCVLTGAILAPNEYTRTAAEAWASVGFVLISAATTAIAARIAPIQIPALPRLPSLFSLPRPAATYSPDMLAAGD